MISDLCKGTQLWKKVQPNRKKIHSTITARRAKLRHLHIDRRSLSCDNLTETEDSSRKGKLGQTWQSMTNLACDEITSVPSVSDLSDETDLASSQLDTETDSTSRSPQVELSMQYHEAKSSLTVTIIQLLNMDQIISPTKKLYIQTLLRPGSQDKQQSQPRLVSEPYFHECFYFDQVS